MKRIVLLIAPLASALLLATAQAGGPSLSIEQSANVGGQTQKYATSISPSDFDPGQIAIMLTQMNMAMFGPGGAAARHTMAVWSTTPQRVRASKEDMTRIWWPMLRGGKWWQEGNREAVTTVSMWALWGDEQGLLSYKQYATLFSRCAAMGGGPGQGGMGAAGFHVNYLPECAVRAYLTAYTEKGFAEHDPRGFVPLCEVTQANSCGIDPGFDPEQKLPQYLRENQEDALIKKSAAGDAAAGKALGQMFGADAKPQVVTPGSGQAQAGMQRCAQEQNSGKLTMAEYQQCLNRALAPTLPPGLAKMLPGGAP